VNEQSKLADQFHWLIKTLLDFYSEPEVIQWLESPQQPLNGESALSLIKQGRIDEVIATVGQLADGVYL
jgi:uncharacterized protein (DUF2384 family)